MRKLKTDKPTRLIFQPTPDEAKKITERAKAAFLKTDHQWIAFAVRKELAK